MAKQKKLNPAELVIQLFGFRPLAADLKCSPTTVWRWLNLQGGEVPVRWHKKLLALAKARGLKLTAEELVYGR